MVALLHVPSMKSFYSRPYSRGDETDSKGKYCLVSFYSRPYSRGDYITKK